MGNRHGIGLVAALLGTCAAVVGCGANDDQTDTVNSALLQNSPYLSGGTGSSPFQTHGATDVGAAMFNNLAYLAFVRTDSKIEIIQEQNLGNNTGQSTFKYNLSDTCAYGPQLVSFNGFLYLFYVGMNRHLYMKRSSDGINWAQTVEWDSTPTWEYRPATAVYNGQLYVFVAIPDQNQVDVLKEFILNSDGVTPSLQTTFPTVFTSHTPAAAAWNGKLYLFWSMSAGGGIVMKSFTPTGGWTIARTLSWVGQPSLFALAANQFLDLILTGSDTHLYHVPMFSNETFGTLVQDPGSFSNHPPAPFYSDDGTHVWVFYPGTNSQVYTARE